MQELHEWLGWLGGQNWALASGALLVSLLSGFLALAWMEFLKWLRRPKLMLSFSPYDLGLVVDTPARQEEPTEVGWLVTDGRQRALRLLIRNTGKTTAHGVIVSMIEFCYFPKASKPQYLFDEVLDLARALTRHASFDLGPKSHRWIDLAFSDDFGESTPRPLRFGFASAQPARLIEMGFGSPGHYHSAVVASSENAEATSPQRLNWVWNGIPCEGLSAIWVTDRVVSPVS